MYIIRKVGLLVATTIIAVGWFNLFCVTVAIAMVTAPIEYLITDSIENTCDYFDFIQETIMTFLDIAD